MQSIEQKKKKIILSGGGTGGSVTPLLAVARELLRSDQDENEPINYELIFVGTKNGPEKKLVEDFECEGEKIKFVIIPAGKFRRYFSWQNFIDLFKIGQAFFVSLFLLKKTKPDLFLSAGGFVSVPLAWAAYFFRVPIIIHQQDVRPGLANRLMAPLARLITVTFEKSLIDYGVKAVWTGNPSRQAPKDNLSIEEIKEKYQLKSNKPIVIITGGGTGSKVINNLALLSADKLSSKAQIIHLSGLRQELSEAEKQAIKLPFDYQMFEFIPNEEAFLLMAAADLVVSRCGLATLTELCELKKPAILIPMPNSHQEDNAAVFKKNRAALVLEQKELNPDNFSQVIFALLEDGEKREEFSQNIYRLMKREATTVIASFVKEIL